MADLIISQPMTFTVDVKNGLVERPQRESLMRGDKMANRIIAELVYGSEPFDITGVTVKGKFCRPPNGDEIDLAGEAKGNVAEVQLTDQCYTSGGHYEARVILVLGGVERTVLFISGDVLKSGSGNAASDEETGGSVGSTGSGLPAGGTTGQILAKKSDASFDAHWIDAPQGGSGSGNGTVTGVKIGDASYTPNASGVVDLSGMTAPNANQLNGKSADQYALKIELPTVPVQSVNGKTGAVNLSASDVGALAATAQAADSAMLGGVAASKYAKLTDIPESLSGDYLPLAGGAMTGPIDMGGNKVGGIGDATDPGDAVSLGFMKGYYPRFDTYEFSYSDSSVALGTVPQMLWSEIGAGIFVAYINRSGSLLAVLGMKASAVYGMYITLTYNNKPVYYKCSNGTWTESAMD